MSLNALIWIQFFFGSYVLDCEHPFNWRVLKLGHNSNLYENIKSNLYENIEKVVSFQPAYLH